MNSTVLDSLNIDRRLLTSPTWSTPSPLTSPARTTRSWGNEVCRWCVPGDKSNPSDSSEYAAPISPLTSPAHHKIMG